ncbi:MAG: transglutaminase domain-containing protein [Demequinaceae bacterium]|nr:transglutaminase domain-containing protein [Demequinaceae bacterium]
MSDLLRSSRSPWLATPLIAVTTLTSLWSLTTMIQLDEWVVTAAFALFGVTLAVMLSRLASRSRIVPSIVGLVASILLLVPLYATDAEGQGYTLPTPTAVTTLFRTFADGYDYALGAPGDSGPIPVVPPLAALFAVLILGLFLVCEHIAVSWRAVASAGLLLFAPWIPAIVLNRRVSIPVLVIGLAAWIAAMSLSRKNAPLERGISLASASTATLASLMLTGLAVPAALGGQGWGSIPSFDTPEFFDTPLRLNLDLDLRSSLNENSNSPVILYVSSGPRPDAFRLYTLTDFDGAGWDYEAPEPTNRPAGTGLLWPESVAGWSESERTRLDVSVLGLAANSLPVPTEPRTVEVAGNWSYDASSDTIIGDSETTRNLDYTIVAGTSYHTSQALRATDAILASDPSQDASDPAVFEVPPAADLASIRALAEELTAGKTTRYDQALAIQNYLRNPSVFTYTTSVDPAPGDAVSAFLESKRGYCLQFATTMVIMLRSIGIPARLGYGFLPGGFDGTNGYVVRGKDAHVWPEVYFPSHGWVRFEPTPSVQSGAPPTWADPFAGTTVIPVPREVLEGGSYPVGPLPNGPTTPGDDPTPSDDAPFLPAWAIRTLGVVVALGLFGAFLLWRRRTVAIERALHGPEGAWQRLADRLGELAWPASATPLEARSHVLKAIQRLGDRPPAQTGADALVFLSGAVSDHRYAPGGTAATQAQLDSWVMEVVWEAESATAEATGRPARGGVRTAPRSGS